MTPAGPMFARQAAGSCVKGHSEGLALAASVTREFTSYLFRPANFARDMNRKNSGMRDTIGATAVDRD
jgi:hypothetical protein